MAAHRIFLLSPASLGGKRAALILGERGGSHLARRLRSDEGAPLGEVFAFVSSLYFRGKLAYARAYAAPPAGIGGIHVITPGQGLCDPEERMSLSRLRLLSGIPIDAGEERYREPLLRDARRLGDEAGEHLEVVLLGSVATGKYVDVLLGVFGERLLFPIAFVGRGDMSRGGLMLRSVAEREELDYAPIQNAVRHGPRPPRLVPR